MKLKLSWTEKLLLTAVLTIGSEHKNAINKSQFLYFISGINSYKRRDKTGFLDSVIISFGRQDFAYHIYLPLSFII